jgi:hypothetical protein
LVEWSFIEDVASGVGPTGEKGGNTSFNDAIVRRWLFPMKCTSDFSRYVPGCAISRLGVHLRPEPPDSPQLSINFSLLFEDTETTRDRQLARWPITSSYGITAPLNSSIEQKPLGWW